MDNKKPLMERVFSLPARISRYKKQWYNIGKWLSTAIGILAIILVGLNAIYLLQNNRYVFFWNTVPRFWKISNLEFFLLVGGFLSSIFLIISSLLFLGKIIGFITRLISNGYNKLIVQPFQKLFIGIVEGIKQSRLWQYFHNLGENIGYKYVLYPALPYLEPTNDRQNITYQTFAELPPEAYSDERFCDDTLQRYYGLGGNMLLLLAITAVDLGFLLLPLVLYVLLLGLFIILGSNIASLLPPILSDPLILLILLVTIFSPFILPLSWGPFIIGCGKPFIKRRNAWAECKNQFRRQRELEEQARDIHKGIGQQLQVSIEKIVDLYKKEFQKTQDVKREFEEATNQLMHLGEQPGTDEKTIKSLVWFAEFALDKRRKEDATIRKQENREGRLSDIVISFVVGFVVSAFFFILGLAVTNR